MLVLKLNRCLAELTNEVALSIPGVRLTHSALPSWWDWRARWTGDGGSYIDLAMTLFDDDVDPPSFGGFNVTADCRPVAGAQARVPAGLATLARLPPLQARIV
jgi:hypothetical protein